MHFPAMKDGNKPKGTEKGGGIVLKLLIKGLKPQYKTQTWTLPRGGRGEGFMYSLLPTSQHREASRP